MILNTYAVLMALVSLLRLFLGLVILGLGLSAWRSRAGSHSPDERTRLEDRGYLVFLLALLLIGLNLVSWPLLYLLLQSEVPYWDAAMCIYGVTQVGKGSVGPSRFLPGLLQMLQLTKPALVFGGGAWFVLYHLNRRTKTAPLLGRLFIALLPLGILAGADAAAELAYLTIPKKEQFPPGGCCVLAEEERDTARFLPPVLLEDAGRPWIIAAYYGANGAMLLALGFFVRRRQSLPGPVGLLLLLAGGAAVLVISAVFLIEIAAPTLLHLPLHHCVYDLIPQVPEAVVAVTFFVAGCFLLGWAAVARWFGGCGETEPFLASVVRRLLQLSLVGFLISWAMLSLELALT